MSAQLNVHITKYHSSKAAEYARIYQGCDFVVSADYASQLESERDALQSWKDSAMTVEREWDAQAIASMLGVPPGQSTRKGIAERVPQLIARVTSLQRLLDQRWEMMRELEEVCETRDVAKAVEYIKGLKARVTRLEDVIVAADKFLDAVQDDEEIDYHDWVCKVADARTAYNFAKQAAKESKP